MLKTLGTTARVRTQGRSVSGPPGVNFLVSRHRFRYATVCRRLLTSSSSSGSSARRNKWDSSSQHSISPMAQQQQMASVLDPCRVPAAVVHGMIRHGAAAMDRATDIARSLFERAQQPYTAACRMHSQQQIRTVVRQRDRRSQIAAQHSICGSKHHFIHSQQRCPHERADRRRAAVDGGSPSVQTVHG